MPDIATALREALNEWEPPAPTPPPAPAKRYFTVTNNVCRTTFDYVRDNPGKTRVEVAKALEQQGFKPGSVSSLMGQMLKQGVMRESAHLLYVTTNEYTPLKSTKALKALAAKPQAQQRKVVKIVNTRTGEVVNPRPEIKEWSVESVIGSLNVRQAMAVYDELRKIFGG
jgi:hypothetical protein